MKQFAVKHGYILFNGVTNRKCYIDYFDEFKKLEKEMDSGFWALYRQEKEQNSPLFNNTLLPKVRDYFKKKGDIERKALNYPVQGTSADITKLAGILFFKYIEDRDLLFKVLMPNVVHDEILVECPKKYADEMAEELRDCMERAGRRFYTRVPLKAEPMITKFWQH